MLIYWIAALAGYLTGSVPTAYLVVRQLTGQDIRTVGSGNVGATNVKRIVGFKPFLLVLVIDFLKGTLPVLVCQQLYPTQTWLHVLVAFTTVLGHSKSVYLGFAGGKSAATGLGSVLALAPLPAVILGLVAYGVTRLTRIVSVGSIVASILAPIMMIVFHKPLPYCVFAALAGLYVIVMHKSNILRLLSGTENRV
jgi:acyl phosphate:glycerol-3-phosphate acyltransferase